VNRFDVIVIGMGPGGEAAAGRLEAGRRVAVVERELIDQWLHTGPSACLARDFLAWAAARGHCKPLTIPPPPRAVGPALSQDQRWALAARLLHDSDAPRCTRGTPVPALYGSPLGNRRRDHV